MEGLSKSESLQKFYEHFQATSTEIQDQITNISKPNLTTEERETATSKCLASISRLSDEVKSATVYLPAHDQRSYINSMSNLNTTLQQTRSKAQPRAKFSFKSARSQNVNDASKPSPAPLSKSESKPAAPQAEQPDPYSQRIQSQSGMRRPSFTDKSSIQLTTLSNLRLELPSSATGAKATSGTLRDISDCIIDLSSSPHTSSKDAPPSNTPFPSLTLRNITNSLIVTGPISGAIHITSIKNSTIVTQCGQLRLHEASNTDVYLHVTSRPVIEHSSGVRVGPLPDGLVVGSMPVGGVDKWDQVEDFGWRRGGQSPNWGVIPEEKRLSEGLLRDVVMEKEETDVTAMLRAVGIDSSRDS